MTDQKAKAKARAKKSRDDLSDSYIKSLITRREKEYPEAVMPGMIKLRRSLLLAKRVLRENNENGKTSEHTITMIDKWNPDKYT